MNKVRKNIIIFKGKKFFLNFIFFKFCILNYISEFFNFDLFLN